jgi:hypothetical protein
LPFEGFVNTKIVLENPNMDMIHYASPNTDFSSSFGSLATSDNGKTWWADWIHLDASNVS